jgi:hypothetical protein
VNPLDPDELADLEGASPADEGVAGQNLLGRRDVGRLDNREAVDLDLGSRLRRSQASNRVDGGTGISDGLARLSEPRAEGSPGLGHELRVMRHPAAYVGHQELRHRSLRRIDARPGKDPSAVPVSPKAQEMPTDSFPPRRKRLGAHMIRGPRGPMRAAASALSLQPGLLAQRIAGLCVGEGPYAGRCAARRQR